MSDPILSEFGHSVQLTGVIYSDDDESWMILLPEETMRRGFTPIAWGPEQWTELQKQTDSVPVEALVQEGNRQPGKAIIKKCERQVSQFISWEVYRRDNFKCRYCGNDKVPLTVDHLVTWESGGPSTQENLVSSCKKCNSTRGETPYGEWLNSRYYRMAAQGLDSGVIEANEALIATLDSIPRSPIVLKGKKRKRN